MLAPMIKGYELSSLLTLFSVVLCGISYVMLQSFLYWSIGLFIALATLNCIIGSYLLVRHAYQDPRFKGGTLINWTAISLFVLVFLWVEYVGG